MDYPIFKLTIDPSDDSKSEVTAIALVDIPAIERNFMAFNSTKQMYSVQSEEQRIISGPLMIPDKPIYRENDQYGKHYIVFDAPTIKQIALKYARNKYLDQVNPMHESGNNIPGVYLFETFISDKTRGIQPMKGYEDVPDGTWFGSMVVNNDKAWQDVKDGTFKGFSVEGAFMYEVPKISAVDALRQIQKLLECI